MPRGIGISEKALFAYNPLPDVTEEYLLSYLLEKGIADLSMLEPARPHPFLLHWQYSGGLERDHIDILPGDHVVLRESEAKMFMDDMAPLGAVVVEDLKDKKEVRAKSLVGLRKALTFYNDRGVKGVTAFRKTQGLSKEDLADYTYDLWSYYLNQAKADAISEEIQNLQNRRKTQTEDDTSE